MITPERLSDLHKDILKEIGNIGAGHAATALSGLVNKAIDMHVPSVKLARFHEVTDLVGGEETVVAATFLRVTGDAPGNMFFILTIDEAVSYLKDLTGDNRIDEESILACDMTRSALQETGNILAGSYLSSFSDFTGLHLSPSVPHLTVDMAGAILSAGLVEMSQVSDYAIIIDTQLKESEGERTGIDGHFLLLPDPDSFEKIFYSLGVPLDE
ncbi:chemotaxis protein CheC [Pseudalkalibacillus berkeleyi]|uniref:Chemotaxis protein CheC n=1 Tax=Pseudalkalibacillus berkeleyi TaxID=1069813 RepID=A0ABS9GZL7_9BACL|nr:chemotaxis protein CheC [Pseudalkalibacillus berkeleyi]MCF6137130.1 chemotaxis protein CheC [Pseudalkalibacillus berkeleyi]